VLMGTLNHTHSLTKIARQTFVVDRVKNFPHMQFDYRAKFGCYFSYVRAWRRSEKFWGTKLRPLGESMADAIETRYSSMYVSSHQISSL